jgi:UDP-galactopyranose mutase
MRVLIVGCGFYGSTCARLLANRGHDVIIIDKRHHIGGNCYTEKQYDIHVHKYGPHAFHTNSKKIWDFVNQYAEFNDFKLKVIVKNKDKYYSFPVNLMTLNQVCGIDSYETAVHFLQNNSNASSNFEEFLINRIGTDLYKMLYQGYSEKQWGKPAIEIPVCVAKRIPVRLNFYEYYFEDKYQGIPINGYTNLFENILDHNNIKINLNTDFFENKKEFEKDFDLIIYSGKPDEFFGYKYGVLEYRSLRFEEKFFNNTYQGNVQINYSDKKIPYTRTVEHKYFINPSIQHSVVTFEYPQKYDLTNTPYYPVESDVNKTIYNNYKNIADNYEKYIFGGRLGRYTYLNMDQVIAMAFNDVENICLKKKKK